MITTPITHPVHDISTSEIFEFLEQAATLAVSAKKHAKLPFPAPVPRPPAAEAEEEEAEEDIEVDLGLQQALIQSIAPSPAKMHTKGNALHDISNWRLPTPAKKQAAGRGGASPLQALTGPTGGPHTYTHRKGNVSCVVLSLPWCSPCHNTSGNLATLCNEHCMHIWCMLSECQVPCLLAATPSKA